MIPPTIGRVVLVQREELQAQRQPAFVTYVHSERQINVAGFDNEGRHFAENEIQLLQDDDVPANADRFAEWMPYQKQQAATALQIPERTQL